VNATDGEQYAHSAMAILASCLANVAVFRSACMNQHGRHGGVELVENQF
jgi:hypothetical protein